MADQLGETLKLLPCGGLELMIPSTQGKRFSTLSYGATTYYCPRKVEKYEKIQVITHLETLDAQDDSHYDKTDPENNCEGQQVVVDVKGNVLVDERKDARVFREGEIPENHFTVPAADEDGGD